MKIYFLTLALAVAITIIASFHFGAYEKYKKECAALNGVTLNKNFLELVCIKQTAVIDI